MRRLALEAGCRRRRHALSRADMMASLPRFLGWWKKRESLFFSSCKRSWWLCRGRGQGLMDEEHSNGSPRYYCFVKILKLERGYGRKTSFSTT
jgi:hypothetical protein